MSASESHLFSPFTSRGLRLRNRVVMSPMCQYSSHDGFASDWHLVHLGSRAVGGVGLVFTEATAVTAQGRITLGDLGIWDDRHVDMLGRIARFVKQQGAAVGTQLAHAGRKASTKVPWEGGAPLGPVEGAWQTVGPSPLPFDEGYAPPEALTESQIEQVVRDFSAAAQRALEAGFDLIEIHAAHGYLLHSFLSPLANKRDDRYGGSLANRSRLLLEVVDAVRKRMPDSMPLFVRISATDWVEGGWDVEQSVALARDLRGHGVDLVDCSSGGIAPHVRIPAKAGYQVPLAEAVRREAGIATGAVGLITQPEQAEAIVHSGQADLVFLARALLREPYWAIHAARALEQDVAWPVQYGRARN